MIPPRKTILVVDDDKDIVEVLCAFIESDGFHVVGVTDTEEGLRLARTVPLTLILCDWSMPQMTGGEFVERLRAEAATEGLPVALMSGHPLGNLKEIGAQAFLPKPFTMPEVLTLVGSLSQGNSHAEG